MSKTLDNNLDQFMRGLRRRNPHEKEFVQAVHEFARSVMPVVAEREDYRKAEILERMTEPDRIIVFRVTWETDAGEIRANRAWRVQFNRSIGPYKGGLRFGRDVNQSILKFLGFEQTFKNSLTGLPMGGAKGGANFNPKGKSDREVMRFCHSLMNELHRHIGPDVDIPAGDIGVGSREIGYLFGHYMRLTNRYEGVLTGKGLSYGGSAVRTEATGYGAIYFCRELLEHHGEGLEGKRVVISGSGNVALYAAEKAMSLGAKVLTVSDSDGFLHVDDGIDEDLLAAIKALKFEQRGRLEQLADRARVDYHASKVPWGVACDIAMPCATQNELDEGAARTLVDNGVMAVIEGANMPATMAAIDYFRDHDVLFAPGKASNAGGVAVSGLELSQNATRISWSHDEVDRRLKDIMKTIHETCVAGVGNDGRVDYVDGANIAGFRKVAEAMLAYGVV